MLPVIMLLIMAGCGNRDVPVMSENNALVSENNASVSENMLAGDIPAEEELLQDADGGDVSGSMEALRDEENEGIRIEAEPTPEYKTVKVKGIYVTGPTAGTEKMDELIELVEETELNAMVIDVKNDEGAVTYKMQSDTVVEIESGVSYIPDIGVLIEKLHEKDIYVIARIVAFKDPYLAEKKPELSLKTEAGAIFRDKNGEAWVNPYKREVWDYLVEIGAQAAKDGFDEIQFDYIRFSTDVNAGSIDYGEETELMTKEEAITGFTGYACDKLHPLGVMVSADVFGTIIDNEYDAEIVGQNYQEMAACLDYICPMVYPSHYSNGVYGLEIPDKAPYDTVYRAMLASVEKLEKLGSDAESEGAGESGESSGLVKSSESGEIVRAAGVRVWIQDFTASWLKGHITYGTAEVRAQIQAIYDVGYEEWILWNARMNYTEGALLPNWQGPE